MTIQVNGINVFDSSGNVILSPFFSAPGGALAGTIIWNQGLAVVQGFNGTTWSNLTEGAATSGAWSWGYNSKGQLGNSSFTQVSSPVSVVGGFTDWAVVSTGFEFVAAVRANGTAWCWGLNSDGQLGDNTTTLSNSPVAVVGSITNWVQISAGRDHTVGIRANGSAWSWGNGASGKLGDNTTISKSSPVSVVGGFTDWKSASAGNGFTIALRSNGTLWSWGYNGSSGYGRLGTGSASSYGQSSPVSVVGGFTDWVNMSAGWQHALAVRGNGTAWAWGSGAWGRLGNNDGVNNFRSPISVVGGFTDWIQVSAGYRYSLGLRSNGTLWAWGRNDYGQLGNNTTVDVSSPVSVVGGFTDWSELAAGHVQSTAIRANGTAWGWGRNNRGQLGNDNTVNVSSPVSVVGGFTNWVQISTSINSSLSGANNSTNAIRAS